MADLDFASATHMNFYQADLAVTSSAQDLVAAVPSGHAYKIDSLEITNVHATDTDSVIVRRFIGATGSIIWSGDVPKGVTVVVISKNNPKRLNDGDKITIQGGAASGKLTAHADGEDHY